MHIGGIYLRVVSASLLFATVCFAQSETDFYDQAIGLLGAHKYPEAEAAFRNSIHADPRYKQAWEGLALALKAQGKDATAVNRMADAAPGARAGAAPALSDEQKTALGETAPAQAADDASDREIAGLKAKLKALEARKRAAALRQRANLPPAATPTQPPVPTPTAPTAQAAPAAPAPAAPAAAARPIEASPFVNKNDAGEPALMEKSGKPIDGVPLSKHNSRIFSPSIAVGRDGTIHVAFCEKQAVMPYAYFVYYRSSTNGGETWTEAKNLSEGLPDTGISRCQVLVDSKNRAYVIWRSDFGPGTMAQCVEEYYVAGNRYNLVYRVLDGGHWSPLTLIRSRA